MQFTKYHWQITQSGKPADMLPKTLANTIIELPGSSILWTRIKKKERREPKNLKGHIKNRVLSNNTWTTHNTLTKHGYQIYLET